MCTWGIQKEILNEILRDIPHLESLNFEDSICMIPLLILLRVFLEDSLYTFAMRSLYSYYTHGLGLPYMRYTRTDKMLLSYTMCIVSPVWCT